MDRPDTIVYDVSRLISRVDRQSPTGIDRVELQQTKRALAAPERAAFLATKGRRSWFIAHDIVEKLTETLEQRWAEGTPEGWLAAERVAALLGVEALAQAPLSATPAAPRKTLLKIPGPAAVSSNRLKARLEKRLRSPEHRVTYRNVSHHHLDKPGFLAGLKARWNARLCIHWHDAIPILWPEYSREGDGEKHRLRLEAVLLHADRIELISEAARADLLSLVEADPQRLPELVIEPLTWATGSFDRPKSLTGGRPYFIVVGTIEPRKNHRMLLEVWRELAAELGEACPALVLAGRRGWMNSDTFALIERSSSLQLHVFEAPELPDEALGSLIASAEALLMPSFAEGFGLPILEAQKLGTPVVASDLEVFHEVAMAPFTALAPLAGDAW